MAKEKLRFIDDPNHDLKIRCSVGLTIEPYGFRQGQRVAMISFNEGAEELTLKQIVLEVYKLKTNCITISGDCLYIMELVAFLRKFINYCKIHMNLVGMDVSKAVHFDKVLSTYDDYYEGMDESDTIVLFVEDEADLSSAQEKAEEIRSDYKFAGKIFIVHSNELSSEGYAKILDKSVHYKTKYQRMY